MTIHSKRVGDNNHVYEVYFYECDQCGKTFIDEKLVKIEEGFYKELEVGDTNVYYNRG